MKRSIALFLAIMMVMSCMTSITFVTANEGTIKEEFGTTIEYTETAPDMVTFNPNEWPALKKQTNKTPRAFAMMYDNDYLYIAITTEDDTVNPNGNWSNGDFVQIYLNAGSSTAANAGNVSSLDHSMRLALGRKASANGLSSYNAGVSVTGVKAKKVSDITIAYSDTNPNADVKYKGSSGVTDPVQKLTGLIAIKWSALGVKAYKLTEGYELNVDIMYHDAGAGTGFAFTPVAYTLGANPNPVTPEEEETEETKPEPDPEPEVPEIELDSTEEIGLPEGVVPAYPVEKFDYIVKRTKPVTLQGGIDYNQWPTFQGLTYNGHGSIYSMMYDDDGYYFAFKINDRTDDPASPDKWTSGDCFYINISPKGENHNQGNGAGSKHAARVNVLRSIGGGWEIAGNGYGSLVNVDYRDDIKIAYKGLTEIQMFIPKEFFGLDAVPTPESGINFGYTIAYNDASDTVITAGEDHRWQTNNGNKGLYGYNNTLIPYSEYKVPEADKSLLKKLIDKAKYMDMADYAYTGYMNAQSQLASAEEIYRNSAATQAEVDNFCTSFKAIIDALVPIERSEEQRPLEILFIGNSLTYTALVPHMFKNVAREMGKEVNFNECIIAATSLDAIYERIGNKEFFRDFDIVFLQESTGGMPTTSTYAKFIENLTEDIKSVGSIPVFYMTSGRSDANYLVKDVTEFAAGYEKHSKAFNVAVAPSGKCCYDVNKKDAHKDMALFSTGDGYHPTTLSGFITAMTLYGTIFKEQAIDCYDFILDDMYGDQDTYLQFSNSEAGGLRFTDLAEKYTRTEVDAKFDDISNIIWERLNKQDNYFLDAEDSEKLSAMCDLEDPGLFDMDPAAVAGKNTKNVAYTTRDLYTKAPINLSYWNEFKPFAVQGSLFGKHYYSAMYSDKGIYLSVRTADRSASKHINGDFAREQAWIPSGDYLTFYTKVSTSSTASQLVAYRLANNEWVVYNGTTVYRNVMINSALNEEGTYDINIMIPWSVYGLSKAPEANGKNTLGILMKYVDGSDISVPNVSRRGHLESFSSGLGSMNTTYMAYFPFENTTDPTEGIDKYELEKALVKAEGVEAKRYTADSYAALENAYEAAKVIYKDASATQVVVDAAVAALNSAYDALEPYVVKDYLRSVIESANALDANNYSKETFDLLTAEVIKGQAVLDNNKATQDIIDEARLAIEMAIKNLVLVGEVSKIELESLISTALEIDGTLYEKASYDALMAVVEDAQEVYENSSDTFEITDAVASIKQALAELVCLVDRTQLKALMDEVELLNEEDYTEETWRELMSMMIESWTVYNAYNSPQYQIDRTYNELLAIKNDLVRVTPDEPTGEPTPDVTDELDFNCSDNIGSGSIEGNEIYLGVAEGVTVEFELFKGDKVFELYADPGLTQKIGGLINMSEQVIKVYAVNGDEVYTVTLSKQATEYDFADLKEGAWYLPYVKTATDLGIIKGSEVDGKTLLKPEDKATRIEGIIFALRMLGVDSKAFADVELNFADYDETNPAVAWSANYVKAAVALGLMKGSEVDGKLYLNGNNSISRQEFFAIFARAMQITDKSEDYKATDLSKFVDKDKIATWFVDNIKYLVNAKIVEGNPVDGGYVINPTGDILRCEIIKMVTAALTE